MSHFLQRGRQNIRPARIRQKVTTGFVSGGQSLPDNVLGMLPRDFQVIGEFSGPTYTTPLILTTMPGMPFDLPTLPILGKYTLSNIRLANGTDKDLFAAVPRAAYRDQWRTGRL